MAEKLNRIPHQRHPAGTVVGEFLHAFCRQCRSATFLRCVLQKNVALTARMSCRSHLLLALLLLAILGSSATGSNRCTAADSADDASLPLLSGRSLHAALQQRRGMLVKGKGLRQITRELQAETGVTVILDRRIDPTAPVSVSTGFVTIHEALQQLAAAVDAAVAVTDFGVYIAPPAAARRLRTLMEINRLMVSDQRSGLVADVRTRLIQPADYSWNDLVRPRQLILTSAQRVGLTVSSPDMIPHDVWAGQRLPRMPFSDFATIVLNQFDLTFRITLPAALAIVPVPDTVQVERRHRVPVRKKEQIAAAWKDRHPERPLLFKGSVAVLAAPVELHEELQQLIDGKPEDQRGPSPAAGGLLSRRFTLTLPAGTPLGQLVEALRQQDIIIRFEGPGVSRLDTLLKTPVSLNVRQLEARSFFDKVFAPINGKVAVTKTEVVVTLP